MASNKKRSGLDQPAGDTLKQIDDSLAWLVECMKNDKIKPHEFTIDMAVKKMEVSGIKVTHASVHSRFLRMVKSGEMSCRLAKINGKSTCIYARLTAISA